MVKKIKNRLFTNSAFIALLILVGACAKPIPWPASPLYDFDKEPNSSFSTVEEVKQALVGHYAHYDVVAYVDSTTQSPMSTFVISYGFTDFFLDSLGNLMQANRFIRAEQKINQPNITSKFSDAAVQAIKPESQKVEITQINGKWQVYRKSTPSLLGIEGDPLKPLSTDPNDPNLTDPDNDGNPGVTVEINIGKFISGEIYITRREIFTYYLDINSDGTLTGQVIDESEQFVVGASMKILAQESNAIQHPDMGLSPILMVPIDKEIDTAEELMAIRDEIFPKEPEFNIQ